MMRNSSRRVFLGALAGSVPATSLLARAHSAADTVRVGVVGLNGRGSELAAMFARAEGCAVPVVCDCDSRLHARGVAAVEKAGAPTPRAESDFRRLLDDRELDALVIATPDHWHGPMTIFACRAGKDVYVEKPACHNVAEGQWMIDAARLHKRVVQVGTQRRSEPHIADAVAYIGAGEIGKVGMARAWIHQQRKPIGHAQPGPVPPGLDWALWQGPAPEQPFIPNRVPYNWHWFWHWGTGELGNNGIHGVDVARWGLGVESPLRVTSGGGKFVFDDDQEVPDTQIVTWEFPSAVLTWEHRMWSDHGQEGGAYFGIAFYGDRGTLVISPDGWRVEGRGQANNQAKSDPARHVSNFLDCVRSRQKPSADIETGVLSTRLCHLGNIAQRTGKSLAFDPATQAFPDEPAANALLRRSYNPTFDPTPSTH